MNDFDAEIYCASAKISLSTRSEKNKEISREEGEIWKEWFSNLTFKELCQKVVFYSKQDVKNMGWHEDDINGIAWFVGIYSEVVVLGGLASDFDTIFKESFKLYFNTNK